MWDLRAILDAAAGALDAEARRRDLEQATRGLDALEEVELHPLIAAALSRAGFGVHPEQRYPGHRARPRRSEGDRCDLVLTQSADDHLLDPLAANTLFGHCGADPADACWIEIKAAHQHALIDGAISPGAWSSQLLTAATADVRKLARDPTIVTAALLLVLFAEDERIAEHDLFAWLHRCLDKSLPVASPLLASFPITDRLGNARCAVALVRVLPERNEKAPAETGADSIRDDGPA